MIHVDHALAGTGIGLQALVETPLGIRNIDEITAAATRLEAVITGYADLGAALGRSRSARPEHWLAVQDRVLIAARAAGIAAIDGPHLGIAADEQFRQACEWTGRCSTKRSPSRHAGYSHRQVSGNFRQTRGRILDIGRR
ncbi:aldolase/citrate lyase family protein [Nocardia jinanensis]|uniref:HpcH/HpaI aldolase/citrate lyase domain-containing protein n=1 Tax=Nocardia jinanensis TaxID=382504 RepID=A0A917RJW6_9NOCA|nr:hypothetical protein GCM10011588_26090 [Nocardia jinanensis]